MKGILFAVFLLTGCAAVTGDDRAGQAENAPRASGNYSITSLYDGDTGSKEAAAKWMDTEAKNMCASDYTLITEESVHTMNSLGQVTVSRLIWKIKCEQKNELKAP